MGADFTPFLRRCREGGLENLVNVVNLVTAEYFNQFPLTFSSENPEDVTLGRIHSDEVINAEANGWAKMLEKLYGRRAC